MIVSDHISINFSDVYPLPSISQQVYVFAGLYIYKYVCVGGRGACVN